MLAIANVAQAPRATHDYQQRVVIQGAGHRFAGVDLTARNGDPALGQQVSHAPGSFGRRVLQDNGGFDRWWPHRGIIDPRRAGRGKIVAGNRLRRKTSRARRPRTGGSR
jgi:hypothetical protein